jgi:hypothetical protein
MNPWWTDQQAGLFGGIAGGLVGILGAILGTLAGVFAPKGKLKSLVLGLQCTMIALGLASLVVGIVAVLNHQPYGVYYPLLLCGTILTVLCGSLLPVVLQRYRQADRRKMEAQSLRRG